MFLGCGRAKRYNHGMPISGRSGQLRDRKARGERIRSTTVLCVRKDNKVVMVGDGQVTVGEHVMKHSAKKTRRMFDDKVLAGFAGSTADAFSLFGRFENKLQEFHGNLSRAAVELAKEWRTDRALRHLDALLVVADTKGTFLLSGHGDVIEPDDGICAIGSGGPYALSAGKGAGEEHKNEREGNRDGSDAHRERDVYFHEWKFHDRRVVNSF